MESYYAHSKPDQPTTEWHSLDEHLREVGRVAEEFSAWFGLKTWGRAIGLLHDIGKYSEEFQQNRLFNKGGRVDHATAGCLLAREHFGRVGHLLSYTLAGHHGGLPNWHEGESGALKRRLSKNIPDYGAWEGQINLPGPDELEPLPEVRGYEELSFLLRFLYSALVDADHTDTAQFHEGVRTKAPYPSMTELLAKCEAHIRQLRERSDMSPLNLLRQEISERARHVAKSESPGLYTFTAPTGAGKTLASLLFALSHAVAHDLRRIVFVIPYISVIEQNAGVFRQVLGRDVVLEHHSSFIPTKDEEYAWQHSQENWDSPVVVTTAVQFFESLYGNRPSSCRKLHNLARSVVVLDEVQTLPVHQLVPCMHALQWLSNPNTLGSSVVLCTATQPALDSFPKLKSATEICPNLDRVFSLLHRTHIVRLGRIQDEDLLRHLRNHEQFLCIVNTRAHARHLFEELKREHCYHLSASMCPAHRSKVLSKIYQQLEEGNPCQVIATSLVEAGVDLDFPVVFRAACGLDSVAQAAGRCNREGRRKAEDSCVYVFDPEIRSVPDLNLRRNIAEDVCGDSGISNILAPKVVKAYFTRLYSMKCLDRHGISEALENSSCEWPYERVARDFSIIDQELKTVIVPYGCLGYDEVNNLLGGEDIKSASRTLQSNVVQISPPHFHALIRATAVQFYKERRFEDRFPYLANTELYDPDTGLCHEDPNFRTAESNIL